MHLLKPLFSNTVTRQHMCDITLEAHLFYAVTSDFCFVTLSNKSPWDQIYSYSQYSVYACAKWRSFYTINYWFCDHSYLSIWAFFAHCNTLLYNISHFKYYKDKLSRGKRFRKLKNFFTPLSNFVTSIHFLNFCYYVLKNLGLHTLSKWKKKWKTLQKKLWKLAWVQLCKLQMLQSLKQGAEASGTVLCLRKWQKDNVVF